MRVGADKCTRSHRQSPLVAAGNSCVCVCVCTLQLASQFADKAQANWARSSSGAKYLSNTVQPYRRQALVVAVQQFAASSEAGAFVESLASKYNVVSDEKRFLELPATWTDVETAKLCLEQPAGGGLDDEDNVRTTPPPPPPSSLLVCMHWPAFITLSGTNLL